MESNKGFFLGLYRVFLHPRWLFRISSINSTFWKLYLTNFGEWLFETQSQFERWPTKPGTVILLFFWGWNTTHLKFQDVERCSVAVDVSAEVKIRNKSTKTYRKNTVFQRISLKMERMMGCNLKWVCWFVWHFFCQLIFVIYIHGLEQLIELSHQDP